MQETRSDNPLNSYSFSYISKNEFESIFKHVRRERRKRQDEKLWERFQMKKQEKRVNPSETAVGPEDSVQDNKMPTLPNYADLDACRHITKSSIPAVVCSNAQKCEPSPVRLSHHRGPDLCLSPEPQVTSPSHPILSPERPDCGCHHLGYMSTQCESPNELLSCSKVQQADDNKLFEITNFDQEFKRVEELRDKLVFTLKSIENALDQNNGFKCLDDEEMQRNRMRTAEFAARFKRNYHYQITRQVNEIRKLSSNESWKKSNFPSSVKKFKSSHQVAVQALQAVEKHLRTTNDGSSHLWLQDFLSSVCEMEKLFSAVFHCDDEEEQIAIKTACSSIALQLDLIANRHKREPEVRKKKKKHAVKRNEAKDNLWMYRTHKDWKTKASELARAKLAKLNKKKRNWVKLMKGLTSNQYLLLILLTTCRISRWRSSKEKVLL
uniref:Vitellogenin-3 n=1 Tax=Lygus hesperus TaxID=30085 RepID=A0A0A9ZDC6_LYGHE